MGEAWEVCMRALEQAGTPAGHAATQTNLLLEAELRGRASHGLLRLPRIIERIHNGVADPTTRGVATWRSPAFLDVDGERGLGPVVALAALDQIRERARETGIAVAAVGNNNHIGMLALYAEQVARDGQILLALSTSEALVHPWGGRRALIGTNPIAIGVPTEDEPFVLDMATSQVAMGKIHDYANHGRALEPGWALDGDGNPTTDAAAAKAGALAPFGEAKGYALGLAFELLVASLTASALGTAVKGTLDSSAACNKGDVFIVVEAGSGAVAARISAYLDEIRACPALLPGRPVAVPGDRARAERRQRLEAGIELADDVWHRILDLAQCAA
ncbi:Ldh family oxidoreductase [Achromobacter denitrificans]|nr:Ldh family oxidoreductase [Achromobacter denitrificans]MBV2161153.1 Ldh family oxidoreductase [Achromobacter denitrificans]MDF3849376.1 Ldh family oxidoreductase [Achromobacter denitrificans]MDX3880961.1 Ldh family oxidoreductase [Achromobacter sp.]WFC70416.1 Ldh family oxidoreductase [Achromobacter denitrificans]